MVKNNVRTLVQYFSSSRSFTHDLELQNHTFSKSDWWRKPISKSGLKLQFLVDPTAYYILNGTLYGWMFYSLTTIIKISN